MSDELEFAKGLESAHKEQAKLEAGWMEEALESLHYLGKKQVHEHGHVILEDMMGGELSIVNSARVSFNQESSELTDKDRGLINFLIREKHSTPFESITLAFTVKAPLFVTREFMRHRIGNSFNEWSARYSEIEEEFYVPSKEYVRAQFGKAGAYYFEPIQDQDVVDQARYHLDRVQRECFRTYHTLLDMGVAKEVARGCLPVSMYTKFKWTTNLRAVLNFLSLRNHPHAQAEIRDIAIAIEELVSKELPFVMKCWNEHGRNSI